MVDIEGGRGTNRTQVRERRRAVRRAVHTPAYASMNGSSQGPARELCEILNISESGTCIQAPGPLKVNCLLPLVLDLSETGARIHTTAHVVWAESSGRTGIRFPELPEVSLAQLNEWMTANELAKKNGTGDGVEETAADPGAPVPAETPYAPPDSAASYASRVPEWEEIQRDVELFRSNLEGALGRIAERAVALTWAGGAAIALTGDGKGSDLICVARAGDSSPELGARRDPWSGFSGECIRSGTAVRCDDSETDPRDGAAAFRLIGIRSLIACPVLTLTGEVIGILEVFSQDPGAFWDNDARTLEGLARIAAGVIGQAARPLAKPLPVTRVEEPPPAPRPVNGVSSADLEESQAASAHSSRRLVLLGTGIGVFVIAVWLVVPWVLEAMNSRARTPRPQPTVAAAAPSSALDYGSMTTEDLKKAALAGNGAAQYTLGLRFASGDGVRADNHQALGWFLKAAESGELHAAAKIASCFWAGKGTEQDYSKAYFWGLLAQSAGDDTARVIVVNSLPHLHDRQRLAEQQEADTWLRAHRSPGLRASP
ncbi:MAG: GAF domain-containing protein [Acidobacteria bacterium]|nr:GAF domain-containing protein [Acidobacteriota bacterium]